MNARTPLPRSALAGPFTTADAHRAGIRASRLRARDITQPFHGVNLVGRAQATEARCRAYLLVMPEGGFLSHETAAELFGVPSTRASVDPRLHVTVPHPLRAVRGRGVIGHQSRLRGGEFSIFAGLPLSTPARVWCELAATRTVEECVMVGDYLAREKVTRRGIQPLATVDELRDQLSIFPGRRGRRVMVRALELIRERVDSPRETVLRLILQAAGVPELVVNEDVFDDAGERIARPDLRIRGFRIALEYEGDQHRTDKTQWRKDIGRYRRYDAAQWKGIRVVADDLRPAGVVGLLRDVEGALRSQGWEGTLDVAAALLVARNALPPEFR